jgi:L-methionine (R)-S-oxide reductase
MESSAIIDHSLPKIERYQKLVQALTALVDEETDLTANLANTAALIFHSFDFHWVGFYWVKEEELVLGPFQGPVACTRIKKGRGVCGTCWEQNEVQCVPNVNEFPGHIACSALSQSELVLPVRRNGEVVGVLDIDSVFLNDFDEDDIQGMTAIISVIERKFDA